MTCSALIWTIIKIRSKANYRTGNLHGNNIRSSNLCNSDLLLVGSVQVDMIRANTGGNCELEVLRFGDEFLGEVAGMEGGSDEDCRSREFLLENGADDETSRSSESISRNRYARFRIRTLVLPCLRLRCTHVHDPRAICECPTGS